MVLVVSLIVMVVGMTSITLARVQTRRSVGANDWAEAQVLASSAAEQAISVIHADVDWRTTYTHDVTAQTHSLGNGTLSWKLVDTGDTDLADDPADSVEVVATGTVGTAVYRLSVELAPDDTSMVIVQGSWEQVVD